MRSAKHGALGLLGLLVAGITPAAGAPGRGVVAGPEPTKPAYAYVANQSAASVSVIDMAADSVVATVDLHALGFSETCKPHHVVVEPDGSFWYVSLIADGWVLKFDRANRLVGRAPFETPGMLALDPHSNRLWVGRSMAAVNPPQRIGVIDRDDMSIEEVDVFFARPHAIALSADGSRVYTASLAANQIAVVDATTDEASLQELPGPTQVFVQFAVSPDGRWLVGTGEISSMFLVWDLIDPDAPQLVKELPVGAAPWHPVFTPDGSEVWFGNKDANTVTVIDASDWSVADVISDPAYNEPHGSAISPDGRQVFISSRNVKAAAPGRVAVIDAATHRVVKVLDVGAYAAGMGSPTPVH